MTGFNDVGSYSTHSHVVQMMSAVFGMFMLLKRGQTGVEWVRLLLRLHPSRL